MSFLLVVGQLTYAEGGVEKISGDEGLGFFRLQFPVKLQIRGAPTGQGFDLVGLRADVMMTTAARGGKRLGWAESLTPQLPVRSTNYAFSQFVTLELQLSRGQMDALEEHRGGGDFGFQMTYWFAFNDASNVIQHHQQVDLIEMNRGVWIDILKAMGYAKLALLEVPIFDARVSPDLAEASDYLTRAQDAMLRGEYREAVGFCRDVLESISKGLRDTDSPPTTPQKEWTKAERLQNLRRALKVFTHPARHVDEVTATFDWSRIDAASAIRWCAALIQELGAPGART